MEARNEAFNRAHPDLDRVARAVQQQEPRQYPETSQDAALRNLRERMELMKHVQAQTEIGDLRSRLAATGVQPSYAYTDPSPGHEKDQAAPGIGWHEVPEADLKAAEEARAKFLAGEARKQQLTSGN